MVGAAILFCCNFAIFSAVAQSDLIFTTIMFRHGDRTPVHLYPTDPNVNNPLFNEGFGQLTKTGKAQHYALGKWLRKRYSDLLPDGYNTNSIYIRSTDYDRTIMSAESNMAGLFPPSNQDIWSNEVRDWQPVPIHVVSGADDNVLSGSKTCRRYDIEYNRLLNSPTFKEFDKLNAHLYKMITANSGSNISSITDLDYFYDTLFIENLYNLTLPNWTQSIFPEPLREWSVVSFQLQCFNKKLQRLKVGLLLNEMIERMEMKLNNKLDPDRRIWVYSAHDTTIANVLMTLNLFNFQCPPYATTLMFELYKNENRSGVSIFFKNDTTTDKFYAFKLPTCDEVCPLDKLREILSPILLTPRQWEEECQMNFLTEFSYAHLSLNVSFIVLAAVLSLILLIISSGVVIALKRRSDPNRLYLRLPNDVVDS